MIMKKMKKSLLLTHSFVLEVVVRAQGHDVAMKCYDILLRGTTVAVWQWGSFG